MTLEASIQKKAEYWANAEVFDAGTRDEIKALIANQDEKELEDRFYRDLEFGTGGMRGILGAGTARMNIYNIRKAAFAVSKRVLAANPGKDCKVALTYDSRRFSQEFARAAAEVFAANGIISYITSELRPVPMLSYMVRHFGCQAGACVTASHNPPDYNGFKVYWETGGQVVPPHDQAIIKEYYAIDGFDGIKTINYQDALTQELIREVGKEFDELYFNEVEAISINKEGRENFKIVFTPLHGTAGYPVAECLRRFGFNDVHVVPEQAEPDGDFPTVAFPNPEDPAALKMAVDLGTKIGADLILGTDPDCDRIGIVVAENGGYTYLNGNQIGCLLTEYYLAALKFSGRMPESPLIIKTIVTTDLQADIGRYYGAHVDETLTGFKWICDRIEAYEKGDIKPYRQYVCGGEESYGFLVEKFVRDKDGVTACCLAAEMVAHYKAAGKTITNVLDELYRRHGVYQEKLHTITHPGKEGADKIKKMMEEMRSHPPTSIAGTPVKELKDIKDGSTKTLTDNNWNIGAVIDLPSSNVLQFVLNDGSIVSVRPSGTEPKIKFYVSVKKDCDANCSDSQLAATKKDCLAQVNAIIDAFVAMASKS